MDDVFDVQSIKSVQSNGVVFAGNVAIVNNSQMIPQESKLTLQITYIDSNNQRQVVLVPMQGQSGYVQNYGSTQYAELEYADEFGLLQLVGTYNSQDFVGDMYYINNSTGGSRSRLGQFRIRTCGFFKCI